MTAQRDPDRLIHQFLMEGSTELADPVYDAVRASIEQKRQRAVIGPWRMPTMNKLVPIGLGAAAVVVALVVGTQLLAPAAPGGVGAAPSASPTPTTAPSPSDPIEASPSAQAGPPGSFVLLRGESRGGFGLALDAVLAAPGWQAEPGGGIVTKDGTPPEFAGMIVFADDQDWFVPGDPCDWDATLPDDPSTTVDEYVAALGAQASRDASPAEDITIDGRAGKRITLHVPEDRAFEGEGNAVNCDQTQFCSMANPELSPAEQCARYNQGPGQTDEVSIVDVDGVVVLIFAAYFEGTPADDVAEMRAIVDSITFPS